MSGKGSNVRPRLVASDVWDENYCMTFGHKFLAGSCKNCGVSDDLREVQAAPGKVEAAGAEVRSGFDHGSA